MGGREEWHAAEGIKFWIWTDRGCYVMRGIFDLSAVFQTKSSDFFLLSYYYPKTCSSTEHRLVAAAPYAPAVMLHLSEPISHRPSLPLCSAPWPTSCCLATAALSVCYDTGVEEPLLSRKTVGTPRTWCKLCVCRGPGYGFRQHFFGSTFGETEPPYLDFMPGLTSTTLSETWTTRMVTSPDSGWLWRLR